MIEAIIFDMDGVLVNSEKLKAEAWKKVLTKYNVKDGDLFYKKRIGIVREDICRMAIKQYNLSATVEELYNSKKETYQELIMKTSLSIKGAVEFLKSIPKDKVKIGLAASTNRNIIEKQLKMINAYDYFDVIVSGEDDIKNKKPHPDIYLLVAEKLGIEPANCIAIEDTSIGIESAKRAGMKCIGYINPDSGEQDLSKADIVIDDFSKLSDNIQRKFYKHP